MSDVAQDSARLCLRTGLFVVAGPLAYCWCGLGDEGQIVRAVRGPKVFQSQPPKGMQAAQAQ